MGWVKQVRNLNKERRPVPYWFPPAMKKLEYHHCHRSIRQTIWPVLFVAIRPFYRKLLFRFVNNKGILKGKVSRDKVAKSFAFGQFLQLLDYQQGDYYSEFLLYVLYWKALKEKRRSNFPISNSSTQKVHDIIDGWCFQHSRVWTTQQHCQK